MKKGALLLLLVILMITSVGNVFGAATVKEALVEEEGYIGKCPVAQYTYTKSQCTCASVNKCQDLYGTQNTCSSSVGTNCTTSHSCFIDACIFDQIKVFEYGFNGEEVAVPQANVRLTFSDGKIKSGNTNLQGILPIKFVDIYPNQHFVIEVTKSGYVPRSINSDLINNSYLIYDGLKIAIMKENSNYLWGDLCQSNSDCEFDGSKCVNKRCVSKDYFNYYEPRKQHKTTDSCDLYSNVGCGPAYMCMLDLDRLDGAYCGEAKNGGFTEGENCNDDSGCASGLLCWRGSCRNEELLECSIRNYWPDDYCNSERSGCQPFLGSAYYCPDSYFCEVGATADGNDGCIKKKGFGEGCSIDIECIQGVCDNFRCGASAPLPGCASDDECALNEVCQDGGCVLKEKIECQTFDDCPLGQDCFKFRGATSGTCQISSTTAAEEEVLSANGESCTTNNECSSGLCHAGTDARFKYCFACEPRGTYSCPSGSRCVDEVCEPTAPECTSDSDCDSGSDCDNGSCVSSTTPSNSINVEVLEYNTRGELVQVADAEVAITDLGNNELVFGTTTNGNSVDLVVPTNNAEKIRVSKSGYDLRDVYRNSGGSQWGIGADVKIVLKKTTANYITKSCSSPSGCGVSTVCAESACTYDGTNMCFVLPGANQDQYGGCRSQYLCLQVETDQEGNPDNRCVEARTFCTIDNSQEVCRAGEGCNYDAGTCETISAPTPSCTSDFNCPPGQGCFSGQCGRELGVEGDPCLESAHCGSGLACSSAETCGIDSDDDGLTDPDEDNVGTDPLDPDSDDDGANDGGEVLAGTDPNDPNSGQSCSSTGDCTTAGETCSGGSCRVGCDNPSECSNGYTCDSNNVCTLSCTDTCTLVGFGCSNGICSTPSAVEPGGPSCDEVGGIVCGSGTCGADNYVPIDTREYCCVAKKSDGGLCAEDFECSSGKCTDDSCDGVGSESEAMCATSEFLPNLGESVTVERGACNDSDGDGIGEATVTVRKIGGSLVGQDGFGQDNPSELETYGLASNPYTEECTKLPKTFKGRDVPFFGIGSLVLALLAIGMFYFRKKFKK